MPSPRSAGACPPGRASERDPFEGQGVAEVCRWRGMHLAAVPSRRRVLCGLGFALVTIGACALAIPVWLGWKVIRDVEAMQRANSPAPS